EALAGAGTPGVGTDAGQGRDCGDHGREPGVKKNAFGLEDQAQVPPELQKRVYDLVQETKQRSGWPVRRTLGSLGVSRTSYYRWLREEAWAKALPPEPV